MKLITKLKSDIVALKASEFPLENEYLFYERFAQLFFEEKNYSVLNGIDLLFFLFVLNKNDMDINKLYEIYNIDYAPLILKHLYKDKNDNIKLLEQLTDWFKGRGIPSWRDDLDLLLTKLNISTPAFSHTANSIKIKNQTISPEKLITSNKKSGPFLLFFITHSFEFSFNFSNISSGFIIFLPQRLMN